MLTHVRTCSCAPTHPTHTCARANSLHTHTLLMEDNMVLLIKEKYHIVNKRKRLYC